MKKLLCVVIILILTTAFAGCGKNTPDIGTVNNPDSSQATEPPTQAQTVVSETTAQDATSPTLPEGAIESDEAVSIALKKAGLTQSQIIGLWSELDYDDKVLVYEVEFSDGKYDYDCDIDAMSGKVLSFDKELDD